jgi:hypothetical protein
MHKADMHNPLQVSDIVWIEMKHNPRLMGQVIKFGMDGIFVRPFDHHRMVIAQLQDLTPVGAV